MGTRLHGPSLILARIAWVVLVTLTLGVFIASVPAHLRQLLTVSDEPQMWLQISPAQEHTLLNLGLSVHAYAVYMFALQLIIVIGFFGLSLLIFWRRSDDGTAIFVSLVSLLYGTTGVPFGQALAHTSSAWHLPVAMLNAIGWGLGYYCSISFRMGVLSRAGPNGWRRGDGMGLGVAFSARPQSGSVGVSAAFFGQAGLVWNWHFCTNLSLQVALDATRTATNQMGHIRFYGCVCRIFLPSTCHLYS